MRLTAILILGLFVATAGVLFGAWWAPFTVGLVVGIVVVRGRLAVAGGAGVGLLAWALPLLAVQFRFGVGPSASALAAIMGFGRQGAIPVVLTLVVGLLLGLCGAWLGSAARIAVARPPVDAQPDE